jgi:hypothetical protein
MLARSRRDRTPVAAFFLDLWIALGSVEALAL